MALTPRVRRTLVTASCLALLSGIAIGTAGSAAAADRPACSATDLSARVTGEGAGMSQPAVYITVTNRSGRSCVVRGYPTITRAATKAGRQQFTVGKGDVMNAPQTKPTRILLRPGGRAWFAVGAATAYDPPLVTFTRLSFATSPGGATRGVKISLDATAPNGKPFPLGITPFMPGVGRTEG